MTKANTNLPAKRPAEKAQPTIIIEGHETFEKLGMTATLIDGVEHFLDRSYAQKWVGRRTPSNARSRSIASSSKRTEHFD